MPSCSTSWFRAHAARLDHADVRVDLSCTGDLSLACDRERLLHVFDNLISNAVQAMPEGGLLQITAVGGGQNT